jgi:hypothetical protein
MPRIFPVCDHNPDQKKQRMMVYLYLPASSRHGQHSPVTLRRGSQVVLRSSPEFPLDRLRMLDRLIHKSRLFPSARNLRTVNYWRRAAIIAGKWLY